MSLESRPEPHINAPRLHKKAETKENLTENINELNSMVDAMSKIHDNNQLQPYVNKIAEFLDGNSTFIELRNKYLNSAPQEIKKTLLFLVAIRMGLVEGAIQLTTEEYDKLNKINDASFDIWSERIINVSGLFGPEIKPIFSALKKMVGVSAEMCDNVRNRLIKIRREKDEI